MNVQEVQVKPNKLEAMTGTMRADTEENEQGPVPELAEALRSLHKEMRSLRREPRMDSIALKGQRSL